MIYLLAFRMFIITAFLVSTVQVRAQMEGTAGKWKPWFFASGKDYRLPVPSSYKTEIGHES